MRIRARHLARAVAVAAATLGLAVSTAGTASATGIDNYEWDSHNKFDRRAHPGLFIDFAGEWGTDEDSLDAAGKPIKWANNTCTMGPVGTDSSGRKIGITAGHCRPLFGEGVHNIPNVGLRSYRYPLAPRGVEITTNDYPVFDRNAVMRAHGDNPVVNELSAPVQPIGWIRWVDNHAPTSQTNPPTLIGTDYMVIEFAADVQLDSQVYDKAGNAAPSTASGGNPFKVNSVYTNTSTGNLPPVGSDIEHFGAMSAREPGRVGPLFAYDAIAPNYGAVSKINSPVNGLFRAAPGHQGGDSGGPVVMRGTGQWVGIITAEFGEGLLGIQRPFIFTSAKNILNDLDAPGNGRTFGVGFTPINN